MDYSKFIKIENDQIRVAFFHDGQHLDIEQFISSEEPDSKTDYWFLIFINYLDIKELEKICANTNGIHWVNNVKRVKGERCPMELRPYKFTDKKIISFKSCEPATLKEILALVNYLFDVENIDYITNDRVLSDTL